MQDVLQDLFRTARDVPVGSCSVMSVRWALVALLVPSAHAAEHAYRDPSRKVGSQSEVPVVTVDSRGISVRSYQSYNIDADSGNLTYVGKSRKFSAIEDLLTRLHRDHGLTSLIDVGCNAGLTSMIAWRAGFRDVLGLDHDSEYVGVFNRVAAAREVTNGLRASVFSFGSPMPTTAQVLFCGAILHWVFCLTANFASKGFGGILKYLLQYSSEYLLVEWIDPSDTAVKSFSHIKKCGIAGLESQYSVTNFESAVADHATLVSKLPLDGPGRVLYVLRVRRRAPRSLRAPSTLGSTRAAVGWPSPLVDRCLNRADEMVAAMRLVPLTGTSICAASAYLYVDATRTMVLKHYKYYEPFTPRQREACTLQALQRFAWAPRLYCTGVDYMLSSYTGRPLCQEHAPPNYLAQMQRILFDLRSIGVRHNDLHKINEHTDFTVNEHTGRMSLIDFGWATVNGSLSSRCTSSIGQLLVAEQYPVWKLSRQLTCGFVLPERAVAVKLPNCPSDSQRHAVSQMTVRHCPQRHSEVSNLTLRDLDGYPELTCGNKTVPSSIMRQVGAAARAAASDTQSHKARAADHNKLSSAEDKMRFFAKPASKPAKVAEEPHSEEAPTEVPDAASSSQAPKPPAGEHTYAFSRSVGG